MKELRRKDADSNRVTIGKKRERKKERERERKRDRRAAGNFRIKFCKSMKQ